MRRHIGPIDEDVIRQYLTLDIELYSISMLGDMTTSVIYSTWPDTMKTYYDLVEIDEVADACTRYLIQAGAPVFTEMRRLKAYTGKLEAELRKGVRPAEARDAALRSLEQDLASEHVQKPIATD